MPTEEYAKMTAALCSAVENGKGAVHTTYGARNRRDFGAVTFFPGEQQPRILDEGLKLKARIIAREKEIPDPDWPNWKPHIIWDTDVLLGENDAYKALVFRVDGPGFVNTLESLARDYSEMKSVTDYHRRPYFQPMFAKSIAIAIKQGLTKIVYPEGKVDELAVRHL